MNDKERKDYEAELFGNVIFSYTDEMALADGVLHDVAKLSRHDVNRVTSAVYAFLGGLENDADISKPYRELEDSARAAYNRAKDKDLVEFTYKGNRFWMMDNETGGRTIMFPEDY
ncbi:MAG: hypothetical protein HY051_02895 [Candidatus Aenigmarchaeota archaeon]|nr:hypothetical protein [Candidatus Aenigmarchaeota archaeon]